MLNPRSFEARRDIRSPYDMHRTLARAFPTPSGINYRAEHQVLFRQELRLHIGGNLCGDNSLAPAEVLVQSKSEPIWDNLPTSYLIHPVITKLFDLTFYAEQQYAFRLIANPTRKIKRPGHEQGKRVALCDIADENGLSPVREWFARKGLQHGFEILFILTDTFWLGKNSSDFCNEKTAIPIYGVRYEGLLCITDPQKFFDAIRSGIGPSKAFGFGLLSLAKP